MGLFVVLATLPGVAMQRNTESELRRQDSAKIAGTAPTVQTTQDDMRILRYAALAHARDKWDDNRVEVSGRQNGEILRFAQDDSTEAAPRQARNDNREDREAQQEPLPVIKREVQLVLVEATVKDRGGKVMKILKKEDFQLYEDGQAQEIAHFSQDQLPLAVAMVVDLSGSIKPFLRPLRYASVAALKALKAEDEVALFTFASDVDRRVELTRDKLAVSDQIEFFEAEGGTNINDALYNAARYLREKAPAARRVIVLVSDNVPTTARVGAGEVLTEALEADAAVYGLKVPGRNPIALRALSTGRGFVKVEKVTEETGGEIFDVEREGSLFLAFQALIERLKTRYTLGFYPANKLRDGKLRKLEVRLQPSFGVRGKDYAIVAKRGYYPAKR